MYDLFDKEIPLSKIWHPWFSNDRIPDIFSSLLYSFAGELQGNDLCSYLGENPEVRDDLLKLKEELLDSSHLDRKMRAYDLEDHIEAYEVLRPAFETFVQYWEGIRENLNPLSGEIKLAEFAHPDLKDYVIDERHSHYRTGWLYRKYGEDYEFFQKLHDALSSPDPLTHPPEFVAASVDHIISGFDHFSKSFFENYEKVPKHGEEESQYYLSPSHRQGSYPVNYAIFFLHGLDPKLPLKEAFIKNAMAWLDHYNTRLYRGKFSYNPIKLTIGQIKKRSVKIIGKWMNYLEKTYGLPLDPQYLLHIAFMYVSGTAINNIVGSPGDNTLYIFNEYDPEIHPALR